MYATTSVFVKCSNAAIARSGIFNMLRNSCFTVKYMKQRKQFGKTLDKFQALSFEMASMKVKIDGARYLLYDACNRRDLGLPATVAAAEAKLACSEAASYVTNKAVQFHGGYGYIKDYPVERMYRDAKITEIYEGTSEVMKMVMSGEIFK